MVSNKMSDEDDFDEETMEALTRVSSRRSEANSLSGGELRAPSPASFSSMRAQSLNGLSSPPLRGSPNPGQNAGIPKIGTIGVCAMDAKARSKPCRHILNKLIEHGEFETVIFGDKVILDESIEHWPTCDFLISFFSTGFPLQKAIQYAELRRPYLVNDLEMQKILWDRRLVLYLLDSCKVESPERVILSRDGGPRVDDRVKQKLATHGVNLTHEEEITCELEDYDTLKFSNGRTLKKPYVEKPVDGEDHNIYVYYDKASGGGGRRLFRKVGNKSSEYDPDLVEPRQQGSYIYEKFMDTDNFEDVKAYTVGPHFCHAETRKSPVVDGVVRRNTYGKELRFVTKLTDEETRMASAISDAFEQTICGFDLLRVHGKSYVIDVNGFSFVKDNNEYYDNCARILRSLFLKAKREQAFRNTTIEGVSNKTTEVRQQKWVLKGQVTVIRHADRTPKQKFKYSFKSSCFTDLLQGHKVEVIIRDKEHLLRVQEIAKKALEDQVEDPAKLRQLISVLEKKRTLSGTKIQIKPSLGSDGEKVDKVQLIVKWGGEPTHSARYQAVDYGEQQRKDTLLVNKDILNNVKVYSSSERRVVASAKLFSTAFLNIEELPDDFLCIRKDLLDDSNAAKDLMDRVKKKLKPMLRQGMDPPPQFTWPAKMPEPFVVLSRVVELMNFHKRVLEYNFANKDYESFQARWCSKEDPDLFRERWDKLFKEFETVEKVDPSKISELYDTMKFDGMHNRQFLEHIFLPDPNVEGLPPPTCDIPNIHTTLGGGPFSYMAAKQANSNDKGGPFDKSEYQHLRELYRLSKVLFDFICPQEYGIEDKEKLDIGLLTSMPLVKQILNDIDDLQKAEAGGSVVYFTKESHIYTLLNVIYESQIPTKIARNALPELDYLSQIAFEVYESEDVETNSKSYSIRLAISPGCNSQDPLDVQLDSKHCISCIPRQALTRHLDSDIVISRLRNRFNRVSLPKKFIPVNISEKGDSGE